MKQDIALVAVVVLLAAGFRSMNHGESPPLFQSVDSWWWVIAADRCNDTGFPPLHCDVSFLVNTPNYRVYSLGWLLQRTPRQWWPWVNLSLASFAAGMVYILARASGLPRQSAFFAGLMFASSPLVIARTQLWWLDSDGGILLFMTAIATCVVMVCRLDRYMGFEGSPLPYILAIPFLIIGFKTWWVGWSWFVLVLAVWLIDQYREYWYVVLPAVFIVAFMLMTPSLYDRVLGLAHGRMGWQDAQIAELREPRFEDVVGYTAGSLPAFILAVWGAWFIPLEPAKRLLSTWAIFGLVTSLAGVRFLLLAVPPLAVFFGAGLVAIQNRLEPPLGRVVAGMVVLSILFTPVFWEPRIIYTPEMVEALEPVRGTDKVVVAWWQNGAFISHIAGPDARVMSSAISQTSKDTVAVARALCKLEIGDLVAVRAILRERIGDREFQIIHEPYLSNEHVEESWRRAGGCLDA